MSSKSDSKLNKTNSGSNIFGNSYKNEKEKQDQGNIMPYSESNTNQKKVEKYELYDYLKESIIELFYDIKEKNFFYKQIKIGGKDYKNINDVVKNLIFKDEKVEAFIKFFEEIEERFKDEYNNKNEFTLKLEIKGDKYKIDLKLDCLYKLIIHEKEFYYKDFDIINNGISTGFENLFYDLNNYDAFLIVNNI